MTVADMNDFKFVKCLLRAMQRWQATTATLRLKVENFAFKEEKEEKSGSRARFVNDKKSLLTSASLVDMLLPWYSILSGIPNHLTPTTCIWPFPIWTSALKITEAPIEATFKRKNPARVSSDKCRFGKEGENDGS